MVPIFWKLSKSGATAARARSLTFYAPARLNRYPRITGAEDFGSILSPQGSGSALKRRGVSAKPILAKFQLKQSYGDPFHAQNHDYCVACSYSGAPGCYEMSLLAFGTAFGRRFVPSG